MYKEQIKEILLGVRKNKIKIEDALEKLKFLPYEDLGFAKIDHHRAIRRGFPEVVFCQNKTVEQVVKIIKRMSAYNNVLATRATKEMFNVVKKEIRNAEYNEIAKTIVIKNNKKKKLKKKKKKIIKAGKSKISILEEK